MIRFRRISALLIAVLMVAMLVPASALGAVENNRIEVQIWPDGQPGYTLLIITAELGEDVELPADVLLPLPDGAQVIWAGEIVGGAPENDIEVTPEYVDGEAGPAVQLTLTTARTAQYEAIYVPLEVDGDITSTTLDWFQAVPSTDVFFSVRIPPNTGDVRMDPPESGIPQTNDFGERLFTLAPMAIAVGDHFEVNVSYDSTNPLIQSSSESDTSMLLPMLAVLLVVVVGALAIVIYQQRIVAEVDDEDDDEYDEDADDEEPAPEPEPVLFDQNDDHDDDEGFLD